MKQILTRSITGLVYVAVIVVSLLWHNDILFPIVCLLLSLGAVRELQRLFAPERGIEAADIIDLLLCPFVFLPFVFFHSFHAIIAALMAVMAWLAVRCALQLRADAPSLTSFLASLAMPVYVVFPIVLLNVASNNMGVLALFIMLWLNDTGAYCVGSLMGKHRLCERLSPKKSWEGFWGGMAFTALGGALMSGWILDLTPGVMDVVAGAATGILISAAATCGDLIESMLKRSCHVKDSGHILPGHGGMLDRIDSLLVASPVFVFLTYLFLLLS